MAEIRLSLLLFGLGNINIHPQILVLINELRVPMGTCLGKISVACNTVPCPASCLKLSVILGMRLVADSSLVPGPSFLQRLLLSIWEGDSADCVEHKDALWLSVMTTWLPQMTAVGGRLTMLV